MKTIRNSLAELFTLENKALIFVPCPIISRGLIILAKIGFSDWGIVHFETFRMIVGIKKKNPEVQNKSSFFFQKLDGVGVDAPAGFEPTFLRYKHNELPILYKAK